ncbi:MAG: amidohydrolase family protein [Planctomycetes bacterium]|nr:amidohydrolase family protein [Planctomycetota bacterium]
MLVLRNVRLVDPTRGETAPAPVDLRLERGRFTAIAPTGTLAGEALDARGRFALPGLIDCHVHVTGVFLPDLPRARDVPWMPAQVALNLRASLESGVTTVRDLMAPLRPVLRLRDRARDPASGWPRIVCSGPMLTVPGGYPDFVPPDTPASRAVLGPLRIDLRSPREARRWVDRLAAARVDLIKVGFSSRAYDRGRTPMAAPSRELMTAIADAAHRHNLPVAVHHTWAADLRRLVELPFDTLEHLTLDEELDDALADAVAARRAPVTTNLEVFGFIDQAQEHLARLEAGRGAFLPEPRRIIDEALRAITGGGSPHPHFFVDGLRGATTRQGRNLARLAERGVLIGAATDAGTNLTFGSLPDELVHMTRAGLTPAAALRAATVDAARLLGRHDLGAIAPGARADLVLYDEDPLASIEALRRPVAVFRDGRLVAGGLDGALAPLRARPPGVRSVARAAVHLCAGPALSRLRRALALVSRWG